MPDADNTHYGLLVAHTVDDAVVADPGGAIARELALKFTADALGILDQRAGDELDDGERRSHGEPSEGASCRGVQAQLV